MQTVRVALAQIAPKLGQLAPNLETPEETIARARKAKARIVVFPELSLTGYLLRDQVQDVALTLESSAFKKMLRASRGIDVIVGFVEEAEGHTFYNAAAYLSKGRVVHVH